MRQLMGFVLAATLLGGCAVYADPSGLRASVGFYVNPAPAVAAPVYRSRGWQYGRYEERHDGWRRG